MEEVEHRIRKHPLSKRVEELAQQVSEMAETQKKAAEDREDAASGPTCDASEDAEAGVMPASASSTECQRAMLQGLIAPVEGRLEELSQRVRDVAEKQATRPMVSAEESSVKASKHVDNTTLEKRVDELAQQI
jgi:hypothetical protein